MPIKGMFRGQCHISHRPFPAPTISGRGENESPRKALPVHSFRESIYLQTLKGYKRCYQSPSCPPRLFPSPAIYQIEGHQATKYKGRSFQGHLTCRSRRQLCRVRPHYPSAWAQQTGAGRTPILRAGFLYRRAYSQLRSSSAKVSLCKLSIRYQIHESTRHRGEIINQGRDANLRRRAVPVFCQGQRGALRRKRFFYQFSGPTYFKLPTSPTLQDIQVNRRFRCHVRRRTNVLRSCFLRRGEGSPGKLSSRWEKYRIHAPRAPISA